MKFDAIVLGANLEGLAAACTLARANKRVCVVEQGEAPGGLDAELEFHPGHRVPGLHHDTAWVRRELLTELELERHGLAWRSDGSGHGVLHPETGERRWIGAAPEPGPGVGTEAAPALSEWRAWLAKLQPLIAGIVDQVPPDAPHPKTADLVQLAKQGLRLRTLGERDMYELMRIAPMCAADWMHDQFEADPLLAAGLVAPTLVGTVLGPRAAGTSGLLLLRECTRGREPEGGLAALARALGSASEAAGAELRLGTRVSAILTTGRTVSGVELEGDERLDAPLVLSALDPRRTLLDLVHPAALPLELERLARGWRSRGDTAVLLVALDSAPAVEDAGGAARWIVARDLVQLERTADGLKYGELAQDPWLDVRLWSHSDPQTAPAGGGTLSVCVHGVSHALTGSDEDALRTALVERVLQRLETLAPGLREGIAATELLLPADLEARYGITGGHLYQGELALDQLWLQRPGLAAARYATSLSGLLLCGSGAHPGGPFFGGAGVLAGRRALER